MAPFDTVRERQDLTANRGHLSPRHRRTVKRGARAAAMAWAMADLTVDLDHRYRPPTLHQQAAHWWTHNV